jgi:hypothetical protein
VCNYYISLDNVGDTECANPVATLSSLPDEFNTTEVVFLNDTSAYPSWPGWPPGGGVPLESLTNLTAFSIETPAEQGVNVGRRFELRVNCANLEEDVVTPVVIGIGNVCDPETDLDGQSYDDVDGFRWPVSAQLVLEGGPVDFSPWRFKKGLPIPLLIQLRCGDLVLGDQHIEPNPEIIAVVHETLGPQPLDNITWHFGDPPEVVNPEHPRFECAVAPEDDDGWPFPITQCRYWLRTTKLPVGKYVISVRMPDARVFQAGITIKR